MTEKTTPKITPLRRRLLDDLASGAKLVVTLTADEHRKAVYEIHGGGALQQGFP